MSAVAEEVGEIPKRTLDMFRPPRDLTCISISYQTRLQFEDIYVEIECPFVLSVGGIEHRLDPNERGALGPLLALYPAALEHAFVEGDGELVIEFAGGAQVLVPPHDRYEAWSVVGPGTYLLVCPPGGGDPANWSLEVRPT